MKKFYLKKSAVIAAIVVAIIAVSCGLTITELTFSTHTPMQGEELTITTKFERADDEYQGNENVYLYYGVRVPEDWTTAVILKATDICEYNGAQLSSTEFEFEESEFYSKLMELSYPREGYKWLAYQTTEPKTIYGQPTTATLVLKVGDKIGSYALDFIAGSSKNAPSEMLTTDGEINYDLAFNYTDEKKFINGQQYMVFQEYLANTSTLSSAEVEARKLSLNHITVSGKPVSPMDVANLCSSYNCNVEVIENAGIDDVISDVAEVNVIAVDGGVEVEAQGAVVTVYTAQGMMVDSRAVNGVVRLNAAKGLNIVKVETLAGTTATKVLVK